MLKSILKIEKGREVLDYSLLVPNPATRWIMPLLFEQARATAWGTPRLSKSLDSHPDIPDVYKPFHPQSVGRWLDDPVYYGELWWPRHSTGIVADSVVREKNPEEEILKIPEYCEALVSRELAAEVQSLRNIRRVRCPGKACQEANDNGKLITPRAAGHGDQLLVIRPVVLWGVRIADDGFVERQLHRQIRRTTAVCCLCLSRKSCRTLQQQPPRAGGMDPRASNRGDPPAAFPAGELVHAVLSLVAPAATNTTISSDQSGGLDHGR